MKDFISFLITNIVNQPEAVIVEEKKEGENTVYLIDVAEEDRGKIIGKEGRVIQALRSLINIKAQKEGEKVFLQLNF